MSHQAPLQPGDPRRVGRYRLTGRITGIPADGPIYVGTGQGSAEVMISMVPGEWTRDSAARDRFAAEAAVARRVPPFCAARILDAGIDGDRAYLVSEYVPGESLFELVSASGVLPEGEIEAVAIGMATGLASVHQAGLVHGSFGPEFVIMTGVGPRVVEFAITPPYGTATPSADMVAWARTVVFAATGKPPATMADLDVLPYYVRDVVAACLNPDPFERPTARSAVLELLGDHDPPAGVLAEGSRRAVPGAGVASQLRLLTTAERAAPAGPVPQRQAQARSGPRTTAASGSQRPVIVPRQASRHGRQAEDTAVSPAATDRRGGYRGQPLRTRRVVLVSAGAVGVCALVAVVTAALLNGGGGSPQTSGSGRTSPTANSDGRSPLSTQPVIPDLTTPAQFAGQWSGHVQGPVPNETIGISMHLATGSGTGTVRYSPPGIAACTAALSLTQVVANTKLILSQATEAGTQCTTAGTVTITLTGPNSVRYVFQKGNGLPANGTLSKG